MNKEKEVKKKDFFVEKKAQKEIKYLNGHSMYIYAMSVLFNNTISSRFLVYNQHCAMYQVQK
jgi:hypothetical protein